MAPIASLIASFLLASLPYSTASELQCAVPHRFSVDLSYDTKATISESELILQTEKDLLYLDTTPGLDSVRILSSKIFLIFKGKVQVYNKTNNTLYGPSDISELAYESVIGEAERSILTPEGAETAWCNVNLLPTASRRPATHPWIAKEIYLLAEFCAQRAICSKIRSRYSGVERRTSSVEAPAEPAPTDGNSTETECASRELQDALNMVTDMAIGQVITLLKNEKISEEIELPEIATDFDVGSGFFKTTGNVHLWNGRLGGIETLQRRSDAVISHKGLKLTAACEIGLDRVEIVYKHYELKYGIKARGKATGYVDGISLAIRVSLDYDKTPCVATLDRIKITHFGVVLVDMTGLGRPLEWLVSTFTEWVTTQFHRSVSATLEAKLRGLIESKLSSLDCEKYSIWNQNPLVIPMSLKRPFSAEAED